jgi:hypothetical protein
MEYRDILTISAAIISGAFIFLSLSITNLEKPDTGSIFHLDRQILVAYLVIAIFSLSSLVAVIAQWKTLKPAVYDWLMNVAMIIMVTGFIVLAGISLLTIIGIASQID